jgi:hypothetical protein
MKAAVELLAEATDVIGSQSRQEPGRIKHNRYAFMEPTLCTTWISCFLHCDESGTGRNDDQLIVGR